MCTTSLSQLARGCLCTVLQIKGLSRWIAYFALPLSLIHSGATHQAAMPLLEVGKLLVLSNTPFILLILSLAFLISSSGSFDGP